MTDDPDPLDITVDALNVARHTNSTAYNLASAVLAALEAAGYEVVKRRTIHPPSFCLSADMTDMSRAHHLLCERNEGHDGRHESGEHTWENR